MIWSDDESIVDAIVHCRKLISEGLTADHSDLADAEEALKLAKERGCKRLDKVTKNGVEAVGIK